LIDCLRITRPDDWHLHLREGELLAGVLGHSAERFGRAIVMPNLRPPVMDLAAARLYRERILSALRTGARFEPLMTLYLTPATTPRMVRDAAASGIVHGLKLYPAGATTHSEAGIVRLEASDPVFGAMQEVDLPLLVHGEVTDPSCDVFDRESAFIEGTLAPLVERFPGLRIVLEHVTTRAAVAFVRAAPERVAATITPHHLLLSRNALFEGGLRPHHYCLPVPKREQDRLALVAAATSGHPRFFAGTDSAPHPRTDKECARGCAGIYSAHAAVELYAEVFEAAGALDRLEAFVSFHGADFYRLPRHRDHLLLRRDPWKVPEHYRFGEAEVVPLFAGRELCWRLAAV